MTVKGLIKRLSCMDQDATVFLACEGYTNCDPITRDYYDGEDIQLDKTDGMVFITDASHPLTYLPEEVDV